MNIHAYNAAAWDRQVALGNPWTVPASAGTIAAARRGEWSVVLTEQRPVPREWFPPLAGLEVLALAASGGQQAPIFAAAGARVTVLDASAAQLGQDRTVAEREGLDLRLVQGDMRDLGAFADGSFDLVFHPVANVFCPEVAPVWREAWRVLRPGGRLLAGFMNPALYLFDDEPEVDGGFRLLRGLPFAASDDPEAWRARWGPDAPLEFSHSLEAQIGGQLAAGFVLVDLYEDWTNSALGRYLPAYLATWAEKPEVARGRR
jgi:SAM-dependent methyltransferase